MKSGTVVDATGQPDQVYLVERDAGLVCRILGLYAARGLDVLRVEYGRAEHELMMLSVRVRLSSDDDAETLRVLLDKASSVVGVVEAAQQPAA